MSGARRSRFTRRKRAREYNGRGTIYAWLRTHYGDVARCRDVEERPWSVLVQEMIADGVRREDGLAPTVKNVSRVWVRVCRDVAAEAAAAKLKTRTPPSRISPDWRPTVVPPLAASPAQQPLAAGSLVPAQPKWRTDPNLSPQARAVLEAAYAQFEEVENRRLKLSS